MTYNHLGSWSRPGPLAPPEWMDRVLDFAETQVKPRKIVMGVGFYGRDWRGAQTTDLVWANVRRISSAAKLLVLLERHPHIRGAYCWVMGQEDSAAWKVLRKRLH